MKRLSQFEIVALMRSIIQSQGSRYLKQGTVEARPAISGEKIITITGEQVETKNVAGVNDYVVRNPGGEEYIISGKKLADRYEITNDVANAGKEYSVYTATGQCFGVVVTEKIIEVLGYEATTQTFEFEPSWGGFMVCNLGDMLVSTSMEVESVYRIGIDEFNQTYIAA